MARTRTAVLVGSLRRAPFGRRLADALPGFAPDVAFAQLPIDELPPHVPDDDIRNDDAPGDSVFGPSGHPPPSACRAG